MAFSHSSSGRLCPIFNRRILIAAKAAHPVRLNQIEQIQPKSKHEKYQVIFDPILNTVKRYNILEKCTEKSDNKKAVIIGAGPAGLTAAYELSKIHIDSIVLEKDQTVGGISRTVNYKDYYFDLGGHRFFTKVKRVDDMWKEVLDSDFLQRQRLSRIYFNKKFFYYPLRPLNAILGLGLYNCFMILASYLYAHLFPSKEEETFEQWVSNRFGYRLYRTFFKTYTEKVWGISCNEIRAEWAAQRIKGLSLKNTLKNALIKQKNNENSKTVIKTLIDSFNYPKLGPGMLWQAVADSAQRNGSKLCLGSTVDGIVWSKNKVKSLEVSINGEKKGIQGTHFISSMPIRELIQKFKPVVPEKVLEAANGLNYRDFLTVALVVNKQDVFPDNWIYIHDEEVKLGRIQNYKNWSPYMVPSPDMTCLGLEYFCFEGDTLWTMPDQELIELGKRELETLGLVSANDVADGAVVRMPKAYPVYDSKYKDLLNTVCNFLNGIENLQLVGRNGMHRYNNMDHSMLTGMYSAENVNGSNHNLWAVNEDQEYLEEKIEESSEESITDVAFNRVFNRLDKLGFATAIGTFSGLSVFFATIFLITKGGEVIGPNIHVLSQYFMGYTVTLKGAFIGLAYSFSWGFLFGWLFAYFRNLFTAFFIYRVKRKVEMMGFSDFLDHF